MLEILVFFANNWANQTGAQFTSSNFQATTAAVSINCFLFASLDASLTAALASVIALQWVADYDAAITRGGDSPLDRAKRHQFRFSGVKKWGMSQIIDSARAHFHRRRSLFHRSHTVGVGTQSRRRLHRHQLGGRLRPVLLLAYPGGCGVCGGTISHGTCAMGVLGFR